MASYPTSAKDAATAAARASGFQWGKRQWIISGCAAALAIGIAVAAMLWWQAKHALPAMDADIVSFVRFVTSPRLKELPFMRQQALIEQLHDRRKEVVEAYKQQKLSAVEAQAAANFIWAGKHLFHMRTYFELPEGQVRDDYIMSLARTKERKDLEQKRKNKAKGTTAPAEAGGPMMEDEPAGLPQPEDSAKSELPKGWPADVVQRWQIFHETLRRLEDEVEQEHKAQKKSAKKSAKRSKKSATQPAGAAALD